MLGFLQGFAYGLWLSCLPWFLAGMVNPRWALVSEPPLRWHLFLRYWLVAPGIAMLCWLTSLWGGFEPSLLGWLSGLAAIPVELSLRRGWKKWQAWREARRVRLAHEVAHEASLQQRRARGLAVLPKQAPQEDADALVQALWHTQQALLRHGRVHEAEQADRLYARYQHVLTVVDQTFDPRELASERVRSLVQEVCGGALQRLEAVSGLYAALANIDVDDVRARLAVGAAPLSAELRAALQRRLDLVTQNEQRAQALISANEAALTAIDDVAVALSQVDTRLERADVAADAALQELRRFAEGAQRYGRVGG